MNILHMDFGVSVPEYIDNYLLLKTVNATAINVKDGIETLERAINGLLSFLKIQKEDIPAFNMSQLEFFEKTRARIKSNNLKYDWDSIEKSFKEKKGIVVNTIHGGKGEEYTTVIGFSLHHGILPHWETAKKPNCQDETHRLLHVLCSRAKKYLPVIRGGSSGETVIGNIGSFIGETNDIIFVVYTERVQIDGDEEKIDVTRLISTIFATNFERALKFRRVNPPRNRVGKGA